MEWSTTQQLLNLLRLLIPHSGFLFTGIVILPWGRRGCVKKILQKVKYYDTLTIHYGE